jgi:hypothetical protein
MVGKAVEFRISTIAKTPGEYTLDIKKSCTYICLIHAAIVVFMSEEYTDQTFLQDQYILSPDYLSIREGFIVN